MKERVLTRLLAIHTRVVGIVLRQFHVEGFVSQYVLESPSKPNTLVFVTEGIETPPLDGVGARLKRALTCDQHDRDGPTSCRHRPATSTFACEPHG
jgi:hypothetical protein